MRNMRITQKKRRISKKNSKVKSFEYEEKDPHAQMRGLRRDEK